MRTPTKYLAALMLLVCAGCTKAEISVARRDYLMAKDHAWIDLLIKAPPEAAAYDESRACMALLSINGETLLTETVDLAAGDEGLSTTGYRILAPAGKSQIELHLSGCVQRDVVAPLDLVLKKDHLIELAYNGTALSATPSIAYSPMSLERVQEEVATLQAHGRESDAALSTLTKLAIASLATNLIGVLLFLVMRRRA